MVIEKPIQLTIVKAVPLDSAGALMATKVENNGESAITTSPQKIRKIIRTNTWPWLKTKGETRQHEPDETKAYVAIFLALKFNDK